MDTFQALLKLVLDEKSLSEVRNRINKDINIKVKTNASQATKEITDLARLAKVDAMQKWADGNSKAVKHYGTQINDVIARMGDLGKKMPKEEFDNLNSQFKAIQVNARLAGNIGKTFGDKLKTAWEKFGGWSLATRSLMLLWKEFKEGVQFVKELDDALTDVAYTSNVSESQLKKLGSSAMDMAKDLNASATNVLEAVKIYSTAKATTEDILRKSKPAIMLSNVSGMSGAESSKTIQTALNQFELEDTENSLMDIVDILEYTSSQLNYDFTKHFGA